MHERPTPVLPYAGPKHLRRDATAATYESPMLLLMSNNKRLLHTLVSDIPKIFMHF